MTVLSRCQRFDLRRVDVPVLVEHFRKIVANEGGEAEDDALALIARAAEGSVRDGLSLLDQALAMGAGKVGAERVRDMLGLADRGRIFDLLEKLLGGATGRGARQRSPACTATAPSRRRCWPISPRPCTSTTRAKTLGAAAAGEGLSAEERRRAAALAERLSVAILARAWQMLLKGLEEIAARAQSGGRRGDGADPPGLHRRPAGARRDHQRAGRRRLSAPAAGRAAADKAERRPRPVGAPVDAADEPTRPTRTALADDDDRTRRAAAAALPILRSFADVVAAAGERREAKLKVHLEEHVSLVRFDPAGSIELHLLPARPRSSPTSCARSSTPGPAGAGWWR